MEKGVYRCSTRRGRTEEVQKGITCLMLLPGMALITRPLDQFLEAVSSTFGLPWRLYRRRKEPWIPFFRGEEEGSAGGAGA
mgnify:CR=1 FL=1